MKIGDKSTEEGKYLNTVKNNRRMKIGRNCKKIISMKEMPTDSQE